MKTWSHDVIKVIKYPENSSETHLLGAAGRDDGTVSYLAPQGELASSLMPISSF